MGSWRTSGLRWSALSLVMVMMVLTGCTHTAPLTVPVGSPPTPASIVPPASSQPAGRPTTSAAQTSRASRPATLAPSGPRRTKAQPVVLPGLVWAAARVPASVVEIAGRLGLATAVVRVADGTVFLPQRGSPWAFPIDVIAADPAAYAAALPAARGIAAVLRPGGVVLALDEARLRRVGLGDRVSFGAVSLRVSLIVPDAVIGDAEMFVTPRDGRTLGLPPDRYLLVRPPNPASWLADVTRMRAVAPAGTPVRFVAAGRARALRQADAVLAPLQEKLRFGEFAASPRLTAGGDLIIDPAWLAAHLVTEQVPILGDVTCNRAFLPALRSALAAVASAGLSTLIDARDYGGCFNARLIAGQPGAPISHHAFGSAVDLNVRTNPQGLPPHQDPRLVMIFARYGITWGGTWLVPDSMHFEALRP